MSRPRLTPRKLKALIKDERMASREYRRLGLPSLAKDEARHRAFLTKKLNQAKTPKRKARRRARRR